MATGTALRGREVGGAGKAADDFTRRDRRVVCLARACLEAEVAVAGVGRSLVIRYGAVANNDECRACSPLGSQR